MNSALTGNRGDKKYWPRPPEHRFFPGTRPTGHSWCALSPIFGGHPKWGGVWHPAMYQGRRIVSPRQETRVCPVAFRPIYLPCGMRSARNNYSRVSFPY